MSRAELNDVMRAWSPSIVIRARFLLRATMALLGASWIFVATSAGAAAAVGVQEARDLINRLESAGTVSSADATNALQIIPKCLERGWKAEAEKLTALLERASSHWPESIQTTNARAELSVRRAQLQARGCPPGITRTGLADLRAQTPEARADLRAEIDDEIGILALREGRFDEAVRRHSDSVAARRNTVGDRDLGRSLNLLGGALLARGTTEAAATNLDQALSLFTLESDERGILITRVNRAVASRARGRLKASHDELESVLTAAHAAGQRDIEGDVLANLAAVLQAIGKYTNAISCIEQSLRIQDEMADCRSLARLHNTLGVLCQDIGDFTRADRELNLALQLAREQGDRLAALSAENNLGQLAIALNQPDKAANTFAQLSEARRAVGDRAGEADALANRGAAQFTAGKIAEARGAFTQSLQLRIVLADTNAMASLLNNLGACDVKDRRLNDALDHFQAARDLAADVGARPIEASAWNNLGMVFKATDRFAQARDAYEQARLLQRQLGDPVAEAVTLNNLMALSQAEGMPQIAIFYGKESVDRFQNVRSNLLWLNVEAQRSFTAYCQAAYRRLATLLVDAGRIPEAEQVIRMLKAEERFEFLQRDAAASGPAVPVELTPAEADWKKRFDQISDHIVELAEQDASPEPTTTAAQRRQRKEDLAVARKGFTVFLNELAEMVKTSERRDDLEKKNLASVRALRDTLEVVAPRAVLVHYVVGPEKLCIILTTPKIQTGRTVSITESNLNRKAMAFRELLRNYNDDPQSAARELYQLMIRPIEKDLQQARAKTLLVSLDGALRYIPLSALHDGSHYLVEDYQVALYTESGRDKLRIEPRKNWSVAGMGLTRSVPPFKALPFVEEELEGIIKDRDPKRGVLPGVIRLDDRFDRAELSKALSTDQYAVLHVASHFVFSPGTVQNSYLLLGDGQKLTLEDIRVDDLRFDRFDLLTLSACETAVSKERPGNGVEVEGFTSEAQLQGAKAILATLWPVNDESTSLLMREFYRLRLENASWSKAEALRQAQVELLHRKVRPTQPTVRRAALLPEEVDAKVASDFSHPYFWAPFVLTGNCR